MSALEIRPWSASEAPCLAAFEPAPAARQLLQPRSAAQFVWAFRANPAGTRLFVATRGARVVARYAALPVRTRVVGEPRTFAHVLDAWLAPDEDEATLRATAQAFVEAHGNPQGDLVLYGWPVGRDAALERALEFETLRRSALLARAVGEGPSTLPAGVSELTRFGAETDFLYACCATHWNASALRDAAFLRWRFAENPFHRYRVLGLVSGATLRGYAVYRLGPELLPRLGLLVDWLVLPGDEEASALLLEGVLACARADGAVALAGAFPEWSAWSLDFQERGFRHHPTAHVQLVRGSVGRFDMLWLRDAWWSTLADALFL
ncbi:MAG: hypothetical protein EXS08_03695 [Planctomycetes bacterium]|nr:hypothetical protein [Planctomycetota bacterium]